MKAKNRKKEITCLTLILLMSIFVLCLNQPQKSHIRTIEVRGTYYEMGYQHGKQCKELIANAIDWAKNDMGAYGYYVMLKRQESQLSLTEVRQMLFEEFEKRTDWLEKGLKEIAPELLEEIRGIADGSNQSYEDILYLNVVGEEIGCSAWTAIGNATKDGSSWLGFHPDFWLNALPYLIVTIAKPSNGNAFISLGMVGCVGPFGGMNDKRLTCVYTTVETNDTGPGVNPAILMRLALQHGRSLEEAVKVMKDNPVYFGSNIILVDTSKALLIEKTYSHLNFRWANESKPNFIDGGNTLAISSHFASIEMNDLGKSLPEYPSSYYRYIRLCQLLSQYRGKVDLRVMKKIDQDHWDVSVGKINPSPNTLCRHGVPDTISSALFDVTKGVIYVATGYPCENRYKSYNLELLKET
jgi:isopenicillin-N N-acyltransferase-like protein